MPRKRTMRRMRKPMRRYSMRRSTYRRRRRRYPIELKYATASSGLNVLGPIQFKDESLNGSTTANLSGSTVKFLPVSGGNYTSGLLATIGRGTQFNQRVGNRIFVKGMQLRMNVWQCPEATASNMKDSYLRVIVHNAYLSDQTSVATNFWFNTSYLHLNLPVDKTKYRVHLDRTYKMTNSSYTTAADPRSMSPSRLIKIWIPINRTIRYLDTDFQTGFAEVTDQKDCYQISTIAYGSSNVNAGKQIICGTMYCRVFFTDP